MALSRPTLLELVKRIEDDMVSRITGVSAILRRSVLRVTARVFAGATHLLFGFIDNFSLEILVTTATTEFLEKHGIKWGITRKEATFSVGAVDFTGTNGTIIPVGFTFQDTNGIEYTSDLAETIAAGVVKIEMTATVPGITGNQLVGVEISPVSPIVGLDSPGTVDSGGFTGGSDTESDELFRGRILTRIQKPPFGGSKNDYINLILGIPDFQATRVFVLGGDEVVLGAVSVYFLLDNQVPIIPNASQLAIAQAAIDLVRPVTAVVTAKAPIENIVKIGLFLDPFLPDVEAAVRASVEDFFEAKADVGGTLLNSQLREAISNAQGENNHDIQLLAIDDGSTVLGVNDDITVDEDEIHQIKPSATKISILKFP